MLQTRVQTKQRFPVGFLGEFSPQTIENLKSSLGPLSTYIYHPKSNGEIIHGRGVLILNNPEDLFKLKRQGFIKSKESTVIVLNSPKEKQKIYSLYHAGADRVFPTDFDLIHLNSLLEYLSYQYEAIGNNAILRENDDLTPKQRELLLLFLKNQDIVISREYIEEEIWCNTDYVGKKTIDVHLSNLRKKLEEYPYRIYRCGKQGWMLSATKNEIRVS